MSRVGKLKLTTSSRFLKPVKHVMTCSIANEKRGRSRSGMGHFLLAISNKAGYPRIRDSRWYSVSYSSPLNSYKTNTVSNWGLTYSRPFSE